MSEHVFELIGGRLSLDFINTVGGWRPDRPVEYLTDYADLLRWAHAAGLIDLHKMSALRAEAERHPRRGVAALETARALREALHDVVVAGVRRKEPPAESLNLVNAWLMSAMSRRYLAPVRGGFELCCHDEPGDLLAFLVPVALDAADVLSRDLQRVHLCDESQAGRCGWLFLDETKNGSRRYCTMKDCGNRAKQRRFRSRQSA